MLSNALAAGYRFKDLKQARIISSRGDLFAKQRDYNFPKPVKLSVRAAWWPAEEVHAWLKARMALRDSPVTSDGDCGTSSSTSLETPSHPVSGRPGAPKEVSEPAQAQTRKVARPAGRRVPPNRN
jgi:hypothetical protein